MAIADGNVAEEERTLMALELVRFGVDENKAKVIIKEAEELTPAESCIIISKMTNEEKKYVTAYLGLLICADGKIEDSELKMWTLTTSLCDLPKMSLNEAVEIMKNI